MKTSVSVVVNVLATAVALADTTISENVVLSADADWRSQGVVTVEDGVTVDLNGYTLWVAGLAGGGMFTSSVSDSGTFDLTTTQTGASDTVKSYTGSSEQALGTESAFTIQPAWKLFADYPWYDVDTQRAITAFASSSPVDVVYDFSEATLIHCYKIQVSNHADSYKVRAPTKWKFYGSNTAADNSWTELDSREFADWGQYEKRAFEFSNAVPYRYYRIHITANGGADYLEFFSLEYGRLKNQVWLDMSQSASFGGTMPTVDGTAKYVIASATLQDDMDLSGLGSAYVGGTVELNGNTLTVAALLGEGAVIDSTAFDLTDSTSSRVSTESTFLPTGPASAAFGDYSEYDATAGHRVIADLSANTLPVSIVYSFDEATVVNAYRVKAAATTDGALVALKKSRAPKAFAMLGSNSGADGDWTELDRRTNETGWNITTSFEEERQYEFTNATAYTHYKIEFYESNGNQYLEFFRLEYGDLGRVGKLCVNVPEETSSENSSIALKGNLRLVKSGAGEFVASASSQSYECGTEVVAGTLSTALNGTSFPFGAQGRDIVVRGGARLQIQSAYNYYLYGIALDGGTLAYSGTDFDEGRAQLKRLRLAADSAFALTANYGFIGDSSSATTIDLGGHALDVSIADGKYLSLYNTTMLNGTVSNTVDAGVVKIRGDSGVVATNVNFVVDCFTISVGAPFDVGGYESGCTGDNEGTGTMRVFGTFRPKNAKYYPCTMQDGSTIDFTGDVSLPLTNVDIATGAGVTVNLAGRSGLRALAESDEPYLLKWTGEAPSATFTLDATTAGAKFSVACDATGLLLVDGNTGFIVIVR